MAESARRDADDSEGLQTDLTDADTKLNVYDFVYLCFSLKSGSGNVFLSQPVHYDELCLRFGGSIFPSQLCIMSIVFRTWEYSFQLI
jgi:hypothetical protein